jgi:hypothetical protein
VAGLTFSTDFPVTPGAFQPTNHAAANDNSNTFVCKLNPAGSLLVYSTYLGGSGYSNQILYATDRGNAIAVDAAGNAYVTGATFSTDFPVTPGAFQATNHAATKYSNAFIAKLNPAGTALVYSTYLGGSSVNKFYLSSGDMGNAIAADGSGDAYVAGQTGSTDFPVTPGAFQTTLNAAASGLTDAFVTKLNPTGAALVYSTYLGGSGSSDGSAGDAGNAIALDTAGNVYVAGQAGSADFPVTPGAFQTTNHSTISYTNAFVSKLNPAGTALVYSTYLGGGGGVVCAMPTFWHKAGEQASGLAIDSSGNAYLAGSTASPDFPVTQDAYQPTNHDQLNCFEDYVGAYNAFITELNSTGSALVYSTYLGGSGTNPKFPTLPIVFGGGDQASGLALDNSGNVYVAGAATSADFPVTRGAFLTTIPSGGSGFVAELNMNATSAPGFAVTGRPLTVTAGGTNGNTSTITVTPAGGFTGTVALTATVTFSPSGAQDLPTLSFGSTTPVSITGTSAGAATLTVTTMAAKGCTETYPMPRGFIWYMGGCAILVCVLLVGIPARQRRLRLALGMLAVLLTLVGSLLACGGGSGSPPCGGTSGTTPGTYGLTVTGTSGSITATGIVTLIVQ